MAGRAGFAGLGEREGDRGGGLAFVGGVDRRGGDAQGDSDGLLLEDGLGIADLLCQGMPVLRGRLPHGSKVRRPGGPAATFMGPVGH